MVQFPGSTIEEDEHIETNAKCLFGFPGGMVLRYTQEELQFVNLVVATHGRIQRRLSGEIHNQEITLDGAVLIDAKVTDCTIHVHSGNFALIGQPHIEGCRFVFYDEAANIRQLVLALENPSKQQGAGEAS